MCKIIFGGDSLVHLFLGHKFVLVSKYGAVSTGPSIQRCIPVWRPHLWSEAPATAPSAANYRHVAANHRCKSRNGSHIFQNAQHLQAHSFKAVFSSSGVCGKVSTAAYQHARCSLKTGPVYIGLAYVIRTTLVINKP